MYTCVFIVYLCIHVHCAGVFVYTCAYVTLHLCVLCAHIYVYMCALVNKYMRICVHVCTHVTYICVHVECVYACMSLGIHVQVWM